VFGLPAVLPGIQAVRLAGKRVAKIMTEPAKDDRQPPGAAGQLAAFAQRELATVDDLRHTLPVPPGLLEHLAGRGVGEGARHARDDQQAA